MGDGFAIEPSEGTVVAPVNGKVVNIFPTKHALGLQTPNGMEVLIHVGIDTVKLEGKGFEVLVEADAEVKRGQPLLKVDLDYIQQHAPSIITPVVFTNLEGKSVKLLKKDHVEKGETDIISITEE